MVPDPTRQFFINPFIVSKAQDGDFKFFLPYYQFSFSGPPALNDLINRLQAAGSTSYQALLEWMDSATVNWLIDNYILFSPEKADTLKHGVFDYGASLTPGYNLLQATSASPCTLIGLPFHTNTFGSLTTQFGPQSVRKCIRPEGIPANLKDAGDIIFLPHSEGLSCIRHRIEIALKKCFTARSTPVFVGGDHSLTYYTFREVCTKYKDLRLIQIDAHCDLTESKVSAFDHLTNANFVRKLLEETQLDEVVQIGVRDGVEINHEHVEQVKINDASKWLEVQKGCARPAYLTIDIDCLDPGEAPEVNHPLPGGLKIDELTHLVGGILENCNVVASDIMEIGSGGTPVCRAAEMAVKIIQALVQ